MENEKLVQEFIMRTKSSFASLKLSAERAINQISSVDDFNWQPDPDSNSIAIIMRHLGGNMKSRWTDFLTTDGEKEFRKRDDEFDERIILSTKENWKIWEDGWEIAFNAINQLTALDMLKIVTIRQEEHTVFQAVQRQLIHYASHIGQIYYICKMLKKEEWKTLTRSKKKH